MLWNFLPCLFWLAVSKAFVILMHLNVLSFGFEFRHGPHIYSIVSFESF